MNKSAKLVTTGDALIEWSNGNPFDGYLVCRLVSSANYPEMSLSGEIPRAQIPIYTIVPIKSGVYNETARLLWTSAIEPTNRVYATSYYDTNGVLISVHSNITVADDLDEKIVDPPTLTVLS